MARANSINLIPTNIENTPELAGIYGTLRKLSVGAVIAFIASGLVIGSIFVYLTSREQSLTITRDTLIITINTLTIEEGLLLTAKQRIGVIDKILADQKDMAAFFDVIQEVTPVGQISAITLDETNKVSLTVHIDTIGEAILLGDSLLEKAKEKSISKPVLAQFTIPKEGGFELSVSFVPKF